MRIRAPFRSLACAILLGALPLAAQLPGNSTLQGAYNFRYVGVNTGTSTATALSALGTITFDGNGGFTVAGTLYVNSGGNNTSSTLATSGTYNVLSNAIFDMQNVFAGTDANGFQARFFGGVGAGNILMGSSTEYLFADLFVAAPAAAASDNVSNATLNGSYHIASMEYPGGGVSGVLDTFFDVNADGGGNLGNVTITGYAANVANSAKQTQTSTGATYTVTGNGTGTLVFPASGGATLLSGNRNLYVARDGSFFFGGGPNNFDMILGVKALPGSGNTAPLNGIYFTGLVQDDSTVSGGGFLSWAGSDNETGSSTGLFIEHDRVNDPLYGAYDATYDGQFTFSPNGTYTDSVSAFAAGAGGNIVLISGGTTLYQLGMYLKSLPMNGTGVFLNPQGVVNAANSAPFTTSISPGQFVTLYGSGLVSQSADATTTPFPTTLGNVQASVSYSVTASGSTTTHTDPMPIYAVRPKYDGTHDLIQAIVPYTAPSDGSLLSFTVSNNGTPSNAAPLFSGATSPGIFTLTPGGVGNGAIQHSADFSTVTSSSPAKVGETVVIYLTGLGALKNPIPAGSVAPVSPLPVLAQNVDAVYIDGQIATVSYQGLTPTAVALYQLNVVIPAGVTTGKSVTIEILTPDSDNIEATIPIGQ
jgi:uncharacterized protein (TIGR03437 family)